MPFTAKQPVRILIPEPKVEVAVAEMLMVFAPVSPIERMEPGVEVPRPIFPLAPITKALKVLKSPSPRYVVRLR